MRPIVFKCGQDDEEVEEEHKHEKTQQKCLSFVISLEGYQGNSEHEAFPVRLLPELGS